MATMIPTEISVDLVILSTKIRFTGLYVLENGCSICAYSFLAIDLMPWAASPPARSPDALTSFVPLESPSNALPALTPAHPSAPIQNSGKIMNIAPITKFKIASWVAVLSPITGSKLKCGEPIP